MTILLTAAGQSGVTCRGTGKGSVYAYGSVPKVSQMDSDIELVSRIRSGERKLFSELVRRHQTGLIRMCMRFTHDLESAEEVVQDAFIKAYEKIEMFEGRSSFKSWLYQIAINTARNLLRSHRHETISVDHVHLAEEAVQESDLIRRDVRAMIQKEVDRLPERQRVAVVLRIYEDLSFKEIAQIMDCPYDTAKANFRHGVMKIREALENETDLMKWVEEQNTLAGWDAVISSAESEA